jgi:hypothetical protein
MSLSRRIARLLPGAVAALFVLAGTTEAAVAPKPLFRDPVHDGAADPSVIYDVAAREWLMFYTNRRANLFSPAKDDVRWVHGTHIGIAASPDGSRWRYRGVARIPESCTGPTLWAPEIRRFGSIYHMWLTVVPGVFADWNAPRRIVHLTSHDLRTWRCGQALDLGSDRVIDASVVQVRPGLFRLWYKDERDKSRIRFADSRDLKHWRVGGTAIDTPGEAPKVFRWRGRWWMLSDAWKGLLVARSDDAVTWQRQDDYLLHDSGRASTDRAIGQHPDVVVSGDRAWLIYFVHQSGEPEAQGDPGWGRRTVLHATELQESGGRLSVDRNAETEIDLPAEGPRTSAGRGSL